MLWKILIFSSNQRYCLYMHRECYSLDTAYGGPQPYGGHAREKSNVWLSSSKALDKWSFGRGNLPHRKVFAENCLKVHSHHLVPAVLVRSWSNLITPLFSSFYARAWLFLGRVNQERNRPYLLALVFRRFHCWLWGEVKLLAGDGLVPSCGIFLFLLGLQLWNASQGISFSIQEMLH